MEIERVQALLHRQASQKTRAAQRGKPSLRAAAELDAMRRARPRAEAPAPAGDAPVSPAPAG